MIGLWAKGVGMEILITLTGSCLVFCLVYLIGYNRNKDKLHVIDRINRLTSLEKNEENNYLPNQRRNKKKSNQETQTHPITQKLADQLESGGILLRPEEFLIAWMVLLVLPVCLLLVMDVSILTVVAIFFICGALPPFVIVQAQKKRQILFNKQLGEALVIIANCLRAGFTFAQAMDSIATEMTEPIVREFSKTVREIKLGVSMETALGNMVKRTKNTDVELLVSAVLIQRQVGGNLAVIIDTIADTIKDRLRIKGEVQVLTASGRISGLVIGLLPLLIMGVFMIINPTYMMQFFNNPIGIIMLVVAFCMECTGFAFVQRIVNIKY
jgi:tight adherence protein B